VGDGPTPSASSHVTAVADGHGFPVLRKQARQDSNLQPPVLERTPSNAGVGAFVDFQRLSS